MVSIPPTYHLPTAEELPDSDDTPVDNELQNDIPALLRDILHQIWSDREDWFFGVDMGIYYEPNIIVPEQSKVIVPDGFLVLGVPRHCGERGRLSYVLWEEKILPVLVLEVVSPKYNAEYDRKLELYRALRIPYYAIYNPLAGQRGRHRQRRSLTIYQLIAGQYQPLALQALPNGGMMAWLPEIGLGLGCERRTCNRWDREWGFWYDRQGTRYPTREERIAAAEAIAQQERMAREQAEEKARLLAEKLRSLGIDPEEL